MLHNSFLGFKTPIGTFAICGLHGLPVWLYGLKTHLWSPFMSHHAQLGVTGVLISGRALCMAVEVSMGLIMCCHSIIYIHKRQGKGDGLFFLLFYKVLYQIQAFYFFSCFVSPQHNTELFVILINISVLQVWFIKNHIDDLLAEQEQNQKLPPNINN